MIADNRRKFELWNGRKIVGTITLRVPLLGAYVVIPFAPSELKRIYGRRYEEIKLPILYRCISDDGVDYTIRRCLDIRKKSKRQIELLTSYEQPYGL